MISGALWVAIVFVFFARSSPAGEALTVYAASLIPFR
jgi:hypothetical protein